ncbi:MAG: cupin domain-containing protein [Ignavibacteria bacterium]|nr:cupin domain-containing protein [Ignavibacteria bacterium]
MNSKNIYKISGEYPIEQELFESILSNGDVVIERILSSGQRTPEGQWLQQDKDEWVILLQGSSELSFEDGKRLTLNKGDYIFIPSDLKHRVEKTSTNPICIWLAVHIKKTHK